MAASESQLFTLGRPDAISDSENKFISIIVGLGNRRIILPSFLSSFYLHWALLLVPILCMRNGWRPVDRFSITDSSFGFSESSGEYPACFSNLKAPFVRLLCLVPQILIFSAMMKKVLTATMLLKVLK